MPVNKSVAPPSGYVKAGALGNDMSPGVKSVTGKTKEGLSPGARNEYQASFPKSDMNYGKRANFISDTDMGLISNEGKSGKY
jgi:hypothetical protein